MPGIYSRSYSWGGCLASRNRGDLPSLPRISLRAESIYIFEYLIEELEQRWFHFLTLHRFLQVLKDVFCGLLNEDIVFTFPSIIDIVATIECSHLAIGRKTMAAHHPSTLPDGFGRHPSSLRLQHRWNCMYLLQDWIGRGKDILLLVVLSLFESLHCHAHIDNLLRQQRKHSSFCQRIFNEQALFAPALTGKLPSNKAISQSNC